ncbi:MAG: radical SAM protein [Eubacterium sp.]|nr:radical SAM protein [Eubacterium sp.]
MNILKSCNEKTRLELTSITLNSTDNYRPIRFLVYHPVEAGVLVYNTLTEGAFFLNQTEEQEFKTVGPLSSELRKVLGNNGFLVPDGFNELTFVDDLRFYEELRNCLPVNFRRFHIYPTTGCNARCYYCFEEGLPVRHMSKETAEKTADFIIRNSGKEPVQITWFGGERTTAFPIIDLISSRLNDSGIPFTSVFKTNGYLLTEDTYYKSKEVYHTTLIQIPIDGTGETYNKTKSYINVPADTDPFKRVMNNIENLLNYGISVDIRLNIGMHNISEIPVILETLVLRFGDNSAFGIFPQVLNEGGTNTYTPEERKMLFQVQKESYRYLTDHHVRIGQNRFRLPSLRRFCCMADSPVCVGITPEGKLSKCPENINHSHFFGSVLNPEEISEENIEYFQDKKTPEKCRECIFYPSCMALTKCIARQNECSDAHKDFRLWKTKAYLENLYLSSE